MGSSALVDSILSGNFSKLETELNAFPVSPEIRSQGELKPLSELALDPFMLPKLSQEYNVKKAVRKSTSIIQYVAKYYEQKDCVVYRVVKNHKGSFKILKEVLSLGLCPNVRGPSRRTALMEVKSKRGYKLLVSYGAKVNASDKSGNNALLLRGPGCTLAHFKLMIDSGADVEVRNKSGVGIIRRLLKGGKDVKSKLALLYEMGIVVEECDFDVLLKNRAMIVYMLENGYLDVEKFGVRIMKAFPNGRIESMCFANNEVRKQLHGTEVWQRLMAPILAKRKVAIHHFDNLFRGIPLCDLNVIYDLVSFL